MSNNYCLRTLFFVCELVRFQTEGWQLIGEGERGVEEFGCRFLQFLMQCCEESADKIMTVIKIPYIDSLGI